jgi:hypothetical protein
MQQSVMHNIYFTKIKIIIIINSSRSSSFTLSEGSEMNGAKSAKLSTVSQTAFVDIHAISALPNVIQMIRTIHKSLLFVIKIFQSFIAQQLV